MKAKLQKTAVCLGMFVCALVALTACGGASCEELVNELIAADSFTAEMTMGEISSVISVDGDKLYLKLDHDGEYDEWYLAPDQEGKKWIYGRVFSEDKWTKTALTDTEYAQSFEMISRSFGGIAEADVMTYFERIAPNFDKYMTQTETGYELTDQAVLYEMGLDAVTLRADNGVLCFTMTEGSEYTLTISEIGSAKVELTSAALAAEVGEVA